MDPIFLTTEATIAISIKTEMKEIGGHKHPRFSITDGGPYEIRTATGREYAKIQAAYSRSDVDAAYDLVKIFLIKGIEADKIEALHPDLVWQILAEILRRSRISETDLGK